MDVTIVNGATGTGVTKAQQFCITPDPGGGGKALTLQAIKTGVFSALTGDLEVSSDGGTTWGAFSPGLDFQTTSPVQVVKNVTNGFLYRFNTKTFTGGTSFLFYDLVK